MAVAEGRSSDQSKAGAGGAAEFGRPAQESWRLFCSAPGEESFSRFYDESKRFVYAVCLKMLCSDEEATDVMQTVYARLLSLAEEPQGRSEAQIDDVIYRITVREADIVRSRRRRRRAKDAGPEALEWLTDQRPAAEVLAHKQHLRELVTEVLGEMPPSLAAPIQLHFLRGLTHDQVAIELGVSRSAATRLIYKAMEELEKQLRRRGISESAIALLFALGLARLRIDPPAGWDAGRVHAGAKDRLDALSGGSAPAPPPSLVQRFVKWKRSPHVLGAGAVLAAIIAALVALRPEPPPPFLPVAPLSVPAGTSASSAAPDREGIAAPRRTASPEPTEAGRLSGRTRTQTGGDPVAGVQITFEKEKQAVASTSTGSDGRFVSPVLAPGDYMVRFEPPEPFGKVSRIALVFGDAGFDLGDVLLRKLGTIRGRLLREGSGPVAGQMVELQNGYEPDGWPRQTTGPDGRFEFRGIPYDAYGIWVAGLVYNPWQYVEMADGQDRQIDIIMGDGVLDGIVTRAGKPMPKVEVKAFRELAGGYYSAAIRSIEMGEYSVGQLPRGRYKVVAVPLREKHLQHQKLTQYVDVWGTGTQPLDLTLPSGRLVGRVTLPGGTPAPFALVRITSAARSAEGSLMPLHDVETSATMSGSFAVEGLPPGRYLAVASTADGATALDDGIELPFDGDSRTVEMAVRRGVGAMVQARVTDLKSGLPVEGAWCDLSTSAGVFRWPGGRTPDGTLLLHGVPAGEYTVEMSAFGYSVERRRLRVSNGENANLSALLFEAGGVKLTLAAHDRGPAVGVECLLEPINADGEADKDLSRSITGKSNKDGVWTVRGLRPGGYRFTGIGTESFVAEEIDVYAHNLTERLVRMELVPGSESRETTGVR